MDGRSEMKGVESALTGSGEINMVRPREGEDVETGRPVVGGGQPWDLVSPESLEAVCKERDMEGLAKLGELEVPLATSAAEGIDPATVGERQEGFGENVLHRAPGTTYLQLVAQQLKDPMLMLLIAAATVSTVLGAALPEEREEAAYIDGIAIWFAVLVVVGVGAGNDYHKELQFRKLNAAKDILQTKVVRGGQQLVVESPGLVVGDIVILETGEHTAPNITNSFITRKAVESTSNKGEQSGGGNKAHPRAKYG